MMRLRCALPSLAIALGATALATTMPLVAQRDGAQREGAPKLVLDQDTGIELPVGFDAELLYAVPKSQGSWVALAFDPKGRLIVSDQDDKGIFRVTLPTKDREIRVEPLPGFPKEPVKWGRRMVSGALGFLYAHDSLYMSTMKGFYRVRDTDGDDAFDEFTLLKRLYPGWEHSAHTITATPDGTGLYVISGNHSRLPEGVRSVQPEVWGMDSLLSPLPDPQGHARSIRAPAGWICRVSPDGKDWTMIASGMRNAVDIAINREGEMFSFDSDLEFDIGSPWYRPTRVMHVTSASEFGWRTGSAKWPDYFEDSNGVVADMGPGSPTGISFGYASSFPAAYREKLFVCDWTFGTIYTLDVEEQGSSYTGRAQEFLHGTPLNIAAMRFGPDGHMYFVIGGRNTESKLYRIRYTGAPDADAVAKAPNAGNQSLRDLRHELEAFHGSNAGGQAAIDKAWPQLAHNDRRIRYAARLAIECQDLALWQDRALAEASPRAAIQAAIALSRHAGKDAGDAVTKQLLKLPFAELDRIDQLALLRAWSLRLIRLNEATPAQIQAITAQLDPSYPSKDEDLNTELCRVLAFLDAPNVVRKTIDLMKVTEVRALTYDKALLERHEYGKAILETMANTPNSQNIHYAYALRRVQNGWSRDDRKFYFGWLNGTLEKSGGKSFAGYIRAIREDAIAHLPKEEAAAVAWLLGDVATIDLSSLPMAKGPPVMWTVDSAMKLFDDELTGRNFANGKKMFSAGRCAACHRFAGEGGYAGPDLGSLGKRFSKRDILVAICDPSDTISEQYQASVVTLKDESQLWGRVIWRNDEEIAIARNPFELGRLEKWPSKDVVKVEQSPVSLMPPAMIAMMNAEELKDLMAYLLSGGNKRDAAFKNP
ncbi:MAG: c-type cytochrome [Planctomycetota bacterium]